MTLLPKSKRGQHISVPYNNEILKNHVVKKEKVAILKRSQRLKLYKEGRKIRYFLWIIDYNSLYGNYPIC